MSLTQARLGAGTEKSRANRSGAMGNVCLELVVALNFRFCLHRKPNFRRMRLIRSIPTNMP